VTSALLAALSGRCTNDQTMSVRAPFSATPGCIGGGMGGNYAGWRSRRKREADDSRAIRHSGSFGSDKVAGTLRVPSAPWERRAPARLVFCATCKTEPPRGLEFVWQNRFTQDGPRGMSSPSSALHLGRIAKQTHRGSRVRSARQSLHGGLRNRPKEPRWGSAFPVSRLAKQTHRGRSGSFGQTESRMVSCETDPTSRAGARRSQEPSGKTDPPRVSGSFGRAASRIVGCGEHPKRRTRARRSQDCIHQGEASMPQQMHPGR